MKRALYAVVLAAASGSAMGQITSVGPFVGPHTESFETQPASMGTQYSCLPGRVFNNTANICEPNQGSLVIPTTWSFACSAVPHEGSRFVVGADGWVQITFDQPVLGFGGYFATIGGIDGGEIGFDNAAGTPVGAVAFGTNQCEWTWRGWTSATPFTRVRIYGQGIFGQGGFIHMDDLQYQPVGGGPTCYANCDGSTSLPALTANDFSCFMNAYVGGQPYANCDGFGGLNANDFACFMTHYASGCN